MSNVEYTDAIDVIEDDEEGLYRLDETDTRVAVRPSQTEQSSLLVYLILPILFLAVTLFGGLRLGEKDSAFIFLKPALVCLVFAALTLVLFVRSGFFAIDGWFSDRLTPLQNAANAAVMVTLFTATVQLYNGLLPESGLPFWVVGFCFFWTIWNNLFAEFDPKRLLRSMVGLFGLAFVVKYLVLANLTAPSADSWIERIIANPGKEAFTWLLDLPRYSSATGYIQFFTVSLYLAGLYLFPASTKQPVSGPDRS